MTIAGNMCAQRFRPLYNSVQFTARAILYNTVWFIMVARGLFLTYSGGPGCYFWFIIAAQVICFGYSGGPGDSFLV